MAYPQTAGDGPHVSRRALLGLGALASAAPLLAACGSGAKPPALLMAAGVDRVEPAADAPVADATAGMLAFARKMVGASAGAGGNWIVSPLSMAVCFAMARVGAGGDTASQLDKVFGFPAQGRDDAFNAITREIVTTDKPPSSVAKRDPSSYKPAPPPIVSLGNALFTQKSFTVGQDFLRTLAAQYGTGPRPVDFASADALAQINAWVNQATAGRIRQLFDQLSSQTRLVLANAVYFHGFWVTTFESGATGSAPFTRADGRRVAADMMTKVIPMAHAVVNGVRSVDLPYAGGDFVMRVILPPPGGKPADVLDPATVRALDRAVARIPVDVTLPKFAFHTDIDLRKVLPGLGLDAPFDPARADFSGIAPGLYVDQAVHRANITVDRDGTEAAATTGLSALMSGPPQPQAWFVADRPFAFMILGGKDRVPLFVGQVNDPTAN